MRASGHKLVKFCAHTHAANLVVDPSRDIIERFKVDQLQRNSLRDNGCNFRDEATGGNIQKTYYTVPCQAFWRCVRER